MGGGMLYKYAWYTHWKLKDYIDPRILMLGKGLFVNKPFLYLLSDNVYKTKL